MSLFGYNGYDECCNHLKKVIEKGKKRQTIGRNCSISNRLDAEGYLLGRIQSGQISPICRDHLTLK